MGRLHDNTAFLRFTRPHLLELLKDPCVHSQQVREMIPILTRWEPLRGPDGELKVCITKCHGTLTDTRLQDACLYFTIQAIVLLCTLLLNVWTNDDKDVLQSFDDFRYADAILPTSLGPIY